MKKRRYVVLDRDGTIIVETHYLSDPREVELIPGVASGLRHLMEMGLGLVLITNQSGIGRGFFDNTQLDLIHKRLHELLEYEDIHLDGIYHCPHKPDDYCHCRKPKPGLIELASKELGFVLEDCFVVGDKESDIELGRTVNATTFLVRTGYGESVARRNNVNPDHVMNSMDDVAKEIRLVLGEQER